jgi:hypothetical protein
MPTNEASESAARNPGPRAAAALTFELGIDHKSLVSGVPAYVEEVGLAADLTVFDVALVAAGGFIDDGLVPLSASRALKLTFSHAETVQRAPLRPAWNKR